MKTDSIGLTEKVTTLATCVKLTRKDGTVMGFTDFARDIVIDGLVYEAKSGYTATTAISDEGLSVDNLDIDGALSSDSITEADLTAGKYDFAAIQIFQVNYKNPTAGKNVLKFGFLGQVSRGDHVFKAEIRGLSQMAQRNIGELYSEECRADLGDNHCKVDMAAHTHTGVVIAVESSGVFTININKASGYFSCGLLIGLTGGNEGVRIEITEHKSENGQSVITTFLPFPHEIKIGDTFTLKAGCDRLFATCVSRFNNYLNFRGEPNIPGTDQIIKYAVRK